MIRMIAWCAVGSQLTLVSKNKLSRSVSSGSPARLFSGWKPRAECDNTSRMPGYVVQ